MCKVREGKLGCKIKPVNNLGQFELADHEKGRHETGIFVSVKMFTDYITLQYNYCNYIYFLYIFTMYLSLLGLRYILYNVIKTVTLPFTVP